MGSVTLFILLAFGAQSCVGELLTNDVNSLEQSDADVDATDAQDKMMDRMFQQVSFDQDLDSTTMAKGGAAPKGRKAAPMTTRKTVAPTLANNFRRKTVAAKAPPRKTVASKAPPRKTVAPPKKTVAPPKMTVASKAPPRKTVASKPPPRKTVASRPAPRAGGGGSPPSFLDGLLGKKNKNSRPKALPDGEEVIAIGQSNLVFGRPFIQSAFPRAIPGQGLAQPFQARTNYRGPF